MYIYIYVYLYAFLYNSSFGVHFRMLWRESERAADRTKENWWGLSGSCRGKLASTPQLLLSLSLSLFSFFLSFFA